MFRCFYVSYKGILFWDFKDERKEQDFGLEERTGLFGYTEVRHRLEMVEKYWHK